MTPLFFVQNVGLGAGLAMDACAVSMSNGLNEPKMKIGKVLLIAAAFGLFQALMPIIGYFAGHAFIDYIGAYIPWIALALLTLLGGKMILDGVKEIRAARAEAAQSAENTDSGASADTQTPAAAAETGADGTQADIGAQEAEATAPQEKEQKAHVLTLKTLFVQAIATSIDALSVGLTIADYKVIEALVAALIIAVVTFGISVAAVFIGKKFGDRLGSAAVIVGGVILVAIGLEICLTGVL